MVNIFYRKWLILALLFLLPVIFLLFLYPATHNYKPLDIVKENVKELDSFEFVANRNTTLEDKITVLMFLGDYPYSNMTNAFNIKELVYDKFKNFKNFQFVTIGSKYPFFTQLIDVIYELE